MGFVDETDDLVTDGLFARLVIADRLDTVVDHLAGQVCLQRTEQARASLVSYLHAHTQAARALRAQVAGEHAVSAEHLREVSMHLERVESTDFVIV